MIQRESANYFGSCGSGSQGDDVSLIYERSRGSADPPLFFGEFFHLRLKGTIIAKWFVKKRLDRDGASVRSAQQTLCLQGVEIASDRDVGNLELLAESFH